MITVTTVTAVANDISADEGKYCAGLFVNLTIASDTVDHDL